MTLRSARKRFRCKGTGINMARLKSVPHVTLALVLLICVLPRASAVSSYTCTILPVAGNLYPSVYPTGFNNQGQIAGTINSEAFFMDATGMSLPFVVPPFFTAGQYSVTSLNNLGQVAGYGYDRSASPARNRGFISNPDGTYTMIDPPPNTPTQQFSDLLLFAINDNGDVSGMMPVTDQSGTSTWYSFLRDSAGFLTLFNPGGAPPSFPFLFQSINNSQTLVLGGDGQQGVLRLRDGSERPLVYKGNIGFGTQFYGINNAGFIVGAGPFVMSPDGNAPTVACPELPNGFTPYAINDDGVIAGSISESTGGSIVIAKPTGFHSGLQLSNNSWGFSPSPVGEQGGSGIIYVSSTGVADLSLSIRSNDSDPKANGADFIITSDTCTREPSLGKLAPGQFCAVSFTFQPTGPGARTAKLVIFDDAPDGPHVIPLNGTGLAKGKLQFSNNAWTFGEQAIGQTSGPGVIYVYNPGTDVINFSSIAITGVNPSDFAIGSNTCGAAIAPYTTCAIGFQFTPQAAGLRSATLLFSDDSGAGRQLVSLEGAGR